MTDIMNICNQIELQKVKSSNVAAIGYDTDMSVLLIEYMDGAQTAYVEVDRFHFKNILNSCSIGAYLRTRICGNYKYFRIKYARSDWRRVVSEFINQIEMPGAIYMDAQGHDLRKNVQYIALKALKNVVSTERTEKP